MIALYEVSKYYNNKSGGNKAVDNVSFEVKEGETLVILGTSGCGKTTTLRMINRLTEVTKGNIFVNGVDIYKQDPQTLRRGIGYVLQHHGLFPHYTVAENIAVVPDLLRWDKATILKRVFELLEKLQLPPDIVNVYPSSLSGGQQQRVGLARALAADPGVLLMDEPLGALDPVTRAGIRREFKNLDELKRKTIVMVTHDVQEAFQLGDRVCLMDKGKVVQLGTPAELLFHPANAFVSTFLNEQRLQIELEALSLAEIWQFLPKAIDGTGECCLGADSSIWDAIETMSAASQKDFARFVALHHNDKKQIDTGTLMTAFSLFKNHLRHE